MRFAFAAALALLPSLVFGAIDIVDPSPDSYWVQNSSNIIVWELKAGDPTSVDIIVVNPDNSTLNGAFSIAQNVQTMIQSVTVTNVTLKVGTGYQVQFVNTANHSQVIASSDSFDVKAPGTTAAPTSSVSLLFPSSTAASGSGSASSASSTPPGPAPSPPVPPTNGAPRAFASASILGAIVACGAASLAVLL